MFSSRTAESFDPEPWACPGDCHRSKDGVGLSLVQYRPRPHFEPTRDPTPWNVTEPDGGNTAYGSREDALREWPEIEPEWMPDPEFARPEPNPILVVFRDAMNGHTRGRIISTNARHWLEQEWGYVTGHMHVLRGDSIPTPAHIEHARRVLTLLAT